MVRDVYQSSLATFNNNVIKLKVIKDEYEIAHVNYNAELIENEYAYSFCGNTILNIDNVEHKIVQPNKSLYFIAWIDKYLIYTTQNTLYFQPIDDPYNVMTYKISELLNVDYKLRENKPGKRSDRTQIFYTSVPIIACTLVSNDKIYVGLIKFCDPLINGLDITKYTLSYSSISPNENAKYEAEVNDLDDYGLVVNTFWEHDDEDNMPVYSDYKWIYISRIESISYEGKGANALLNHTKYIKQRVNVILDSLPLYDALKHIVCEYAEG